MGSKVQIFVGCIIHCVESFQIQVIDKGFIIVKDKEIIAIDDVSVLESTKLQFEITDNVPITFLSDSQFLIPGLIDTHIHAPQYPNIGLGYNMQLLDWLNTYTFPLEEQYNDVNFAERIYSAVVKRTLSHGTTTACYFATIHLKSTLKLCDVVIKAGQRALVGKVNMIKLCPPGLCENVEKSVETTEKFIKAVLALKNDLVKPIITPRFALNCDMNLMTQLGALATKYNLHIQTHISENEEEIKQVIDIFKNKYAFVYDAAGLLTPKTILAHAIHLDSDEIQLLADRMSSVSHCPSSNTCLQSGLFDIRKLLHLGISVGLGTDVSGGRSPSIIEAMRDAITTSIHTSYQKSEHKPLNYQEVFYLATLGGAEALTLDDKIGNFNIGKEFDGLIIDMNVQNSNVDLLQNCKPLELLQKFIYTGDDRNVSKVFVQGKQIK